MTAALRLIDRLHDTYGTLIDLFVLDALYGNGPPMTRVNQLGYGAIITLKKETDEPLKDGLALMQGQPPSCTWDDTERREHIRAWDVQGVETLDTFKGKVRVIKAIVQSKKGEARTWCAGVVGRKASGLSIKTIHQIQRARWHEENTAFNQWTRHWHLNHVFHHTPGAVIAVMLLWCLAFNLLQLFVYKRLRRPRTPRDPCNTIRAVVEQMARQVFAIPTVLPWPFNFDSS
jgi:hypothetical protein